MENNESKNVTFRFSPEELAQIDRLQAITGMSKVDIIRQGLQLVEEKENEFQTEYETVWNTIQPIITHMEHVRDLGHSSEHTAGLRKEEEAFLKILHKMEDAMMEHPWFKWGVEDLDDFEGQKNLKDALKRLKKN